MQVRPNSAVFFSFLNLTASRLLGQKEDVSDVVPLLSASSWQTERDLCNAVIPRRPPSQQAQPSNFKALQASKPGCYACCRPPSREPLLPLTLIHPVFGEFVDDIETITPMRSDYAMAFELRQATTIFTSESERRFAVYTIFRTYGIDIHPGPVGSSENKTDGHVSSATKLGFILEIKTEIGSKGAEPSLQALAYYRVFCDEYNLWTDYSTCHPCFIAFLAGQSTIRPLASFVLILDLGPHLGFGGCALTTCPTLEMFSNVLLDFHSSSDTGFRNLARHLAALKKALKSLDLDGTQACDRIDIDSSRPAELQPNFPYPTSFVSHGPGDKQRIHFTYEANVEGRTFLYRGKLRNGVDDRYICIKFVQKYGVDVHRWCADNGFAPQLIAYQDLPGGWSMVIMEFLDQSWMPIMKMKTRPDRLADEIFSTVIKLHENGMVHGDLRDTNLLVKQHGVPEFMLIDFDWAGYSGKVMYPRHVNISPTLGRPDGVEDGKPISVDHNIAMLQHLFPNAPELVHAHYTKGSETLQTHSN